MTKIYHPNIDLEGHVCLNILRDEWKPVLDINAVIYGIIYLFYEPNPNDPLNHGEFTAAKMMQSFFELGQCAACRLHNRAFPGAEAAALYRENRDAFVRNVDSSLRGGRIGGTAFPRLL